MVREEHQQWATARLDLQSPFIQSIDIIQYYRDTSITIGISRSGATSAAAAAPSPPPMSHHILLLLLLLVYIDIIIIIVAIVVVAVVLVCVSPQ